MFLIFLLAGIMTSKSFKFLQDYRAPDGNNKGKSGAYYIFYNSPDDLGFKAFGSYYLLFNQFIPFELVILIEMSKIYYTSFMEKDIELHNVEAGNSFKVQNLSMHEEMG
jgi:magnesium-transporting ATPase (P-type)